MLSGTLLVAGGVARYTAGGSRTAGKKGARRYKEQEVALALHRANQRLPTTSTPLPFPDPFTLSKFNVAQGLVHFSAYGRISCE